MTWGFIWMVVVLKIPIVALLWLVWWAVHAEPEPAGEESGRRRRRRPLAAPAQAAPAAPRGSRRAGATAAAAHPRPRAALR